MDDAESIPGWFESKVVATFDELSEVYLTRVSRSVSLLAHLLRTHSDTFVHIQGGASAYFLFMFVFYFWIIVTLPSTPVELCAAYVWGFYYGAISK